MENRRFRHTFVFKAPQPGYAMFGMNYHRTPTSDARAAVAPVRTR